MDRAEEILVKLGQGALAHEARKCLLEIYQQRNWPRAIELARELKSGPTSAFSTSWRNTTASWRKAR